MVRPHKPQSLAVLKRQAVACAICGLLLTGIIAALYVQHRQREWQLRGEQAQHRLDVAFELISREVNRVRGDALYLANREAVRSFVSDRAFRLNELLADFLQFVNQKEMYDQIRLLDLSGHEIVRINFAGQSAKAVEETDLQDKSDRYYFQEALSLGRDELFVSEFDLNLEHGVIERPLKPVIRFVTPVYDSSDKVAAYLVLNYLGGELLDELDDSTIVGKTLLLRRDSHYINGPERADRWGWLLNHSRTFQTQFPAEWSRIGQLSSCQLTDSGAFAAKTIPLLGMGSPAGPSSSGRQSKPTSADAEPTSDSITVVSYLPRHLVFVESNELLQRLLIFAGGVFALAIGFTRAWAGATLSREMQAQRIASSEERLRDLSARLLRIQEDERRAISREIHDELGQQATAISLDLKLAQRNLKSEKAKPHLDRAINENETLLRTLHEFARRVRPAVLDDIGLKEALESHLMEFETRSGVTVNAKLDLSTSNLTDEIADHTFRLVQESLNNIAKHAGASKADVEVAVVDDNSKLVISVRDNGVGNPNVESRGRLGLIGMQERVSLLGGHFSIESDEKGGTDVAIQLPLFAQQESEP